MAAWERQNKIVKRKKYNVLRDLKVSVGRKKGHIPSPNKESDAKGLIFVIKNGITRRQQ
jgi:hypothetical protein